MTRLAAEKGQPSHPLGDDAVRESDLGALVIRGGEVVELVPDAVGIVGTVLGLVQGQGLLPAVAGVGGVVEGGVGVAEPIQGVGFQVGVADVAEQGEGLLVVVQGFEVVTAVVGDVAEAVQGGRLPFAFVVVATCGRSRATGTGSAGTVQEPCGCQAAPSSGT